MESYLDITTMSRMLDIVVAPTGDWGPASPE
jgi:hypothetical protein